MSTRTIADIEADIAALKNANPNWLTNAGDKALITSLTNEKNLLSAPAPVAPHDWTGSVFFVFLDTNIPVTSATTRVLSSQHHGGTRSHGLEVTGSGFAINPRRFITCHHNVFNEVTSTICDRVAICTNLKKNGNQIIPHPQFPVYSANLLQYDDSDLDFAIFELLPNEPDLVPIPICPVNSLPSAGYPNLGCIYGAIGDFQVGEFDELAIWRAGPHAVLQYHGCKMLSEHGLCRGSSGVAIVINGHVVALHLASLDQGRHVFKLLKGSSLRKEVVEVKESVTDMQTIYSSYKEGLVLCRVQAIMDAV